MTENPRITPDMTAEEILTRWPGTARVFVRWGIKAMVCGEPAWGTVRELAEKAGVRDLDGLCKALSEAAGQDPRVSLL